MGPWETAPEEVVEEELDIFAELGALRPGATASQPQLNQQMPSQNQSADPLAMFMDDDEDETLLAGQSAQPLESQMEAIGTTAISQEDASVQPNFASPVSNEVISELLEILVKKELHSRHERGEDWLSDLPAEAVAKIESAKVIKDQEAYHLSLIIDMVGTGQFDRLQPCFRPSRGHFLWPRHLRSHRVGIHSTMPFENFFSAL